MELLSVLTSILLFSLVMFLLYVYYMSRSHWKLRQLGIKGPTPWPVLGNLHQEMKTGFAQYHRENYERYKKEKVYGMYRGKQPMIVVCDLDLIRDICVKNFHHFANRTVIEHIEEPFKYSLTQLKDEDWKRVRTTMSPSFNTARLKRLYNHIENNTNILVNYVRNKQERNEPVELKDCLSSFTMDVIASTGFGVQTNCLEDENNEFKKTIDLLFKANGKIIGIAFFFEFLLPILQFFGVRLMPKEPLDYITSLVSTAKEGRKQETGSGPVRNDFLQLMIEAENDKIGDNDNMTEEEAKALGTHSRKKGLSDGEIKGQAAIFVLAGFDTVASALSFTLFLMTVHPETIEKAQEEVDRVLDGKFPDYDSAQKLTYLDMCLLEGMRIYPPAPIVDRICNEEIELNGIHFPKGVNVTFPFCGIHMDPDIWPEPEKYEPERHTSERRAKRHPYAHMPFGMGPRNCIGMRLALLEMKVSLAAILQKFTPMKCDKTVYPIEFEALRVRAKDGLWVKFEAR